MRRFSSWLLLSALCLVCFGCHSKGHLLLESGSPFPDDLYYKMEGSCTNGDLAFHYLQATGLLLWTDPAAVLYAQLELFLNHDGTYFARYREFTRDANVYDTSWESRYQVDAAGTRADFKGLGSAELISVNGHYRLQMTYTASIHNMLMQNQLNDFRVIDYVDGWQTSRKSYCGL